MDRTLTVAFERNFDSVPFAQIDTRVSLRITARAGRSAGTASGFPALAAGGGLGERVAHQQCTYPLGPLSGLGPGKGAGMTPNGSGPPLVVTERIFESVPIAEQGLDPALAARRLSLRFSSADRLEAACSLALTGRIIHHATRICSRSWPPDRTSLQGYGTLRGTRTRKRIHPRRRLLRRRCQVSGIGIGTKRKLREMRATVLLETIEAHEEH